MSPRARWLIGLALAGAAVAAVALGRLAFETREQSLPPLPVTTVPEVWRDFRGSPGHVAHVDKQGIPCKKCHDVEQGFTRPSMTVCAACHAHEARMQHALTSAARADVFGGVADCLACHGFGAEHSDRVWQCARCHDRPMAKLDAIAVHGDVACKNCHHPHDDPAIEPSACVGCHAKERNHHGDKPAGSAASCLDCHKPHAHAQLANERCEECHKDKPHALFTLAARDAGPPAGHDKCSGCHVAHGFDRDQVKPCRTCHESQHVLAETKVDAHRRCTSCHEPHAVKSVSDATCQRCHSSVSPQHPKTENHACLGCHEPHPKAMSATLLAQPCTECHHIAQNDQGAHGGKAACTNCHQPHAFAHPEQGKACTQCHALQLTAIAKNPGHASCLGCHHGSPHAAHNAPLACGTCHKQVHPRQEHLECTRCHEPHSGTPRATSESCGSCHARQQHVAVVAHQACLTCHSPHAGGKKPPAECKTCHAPKAAQNHGALPGGCTQCHGIHAEQGVRATPACTSCHDPKQLPGLHSAKDHQTCLTCHKGAHNLGPFSERATCTACHKDKQNHVPEAQLCQGCHVFRK